jgi:hypothetical protein
MEKCALAKKSARATRRTRGAYGILGAVDTKDAPDQLPLPDLYLIDSESLLRELDRIRGLVLQIPFTEASHAATQSVVDAVWHLQRDLQEILKLRATMHSRWTQRAEALQETSQPPDVGLRVVE